MTNNMKFFTGVVAFWLTMLVVAAVRSYPHPDFWALGVGFFLFTGLPVAFIGFMLAISDEIGGY